MIDRQTGRVDLRVTLLQPFHHGAGSSGTTAMLRTKPVIDPETGERYDVPYLSANSVRHRIRASAAWHAIRTAGIDDGSLSRGAVHLLMSGGSLSATGSSVNLRQARRLAELVPGLALMGFSAGNRMPAGKLMVSDLDLVCAENRWRAPEDVRDDGRSGTPFGVWVDDCMSTRKSPLGDDDVRRLLPAAEREALDDDASKRLAKSRRGERSEGDPESLQAIYEHQILVTGAGFWGDIHYRGLDALERAALVAALSWWCIGEHADGRPLFHLGARESHGWGRAAIEFRGVTFARPAERPSDLRPVAPGARPPELVAYEEHLREHAAEIRAMLQEAA